MSGWLSVLLGIVLGAAALAVLVTFFRTGRPVRYLLTSFVQGVCAIAAVDIVGIFTGVSMGFSVFTMLSCAAFGMPGVISMLLMRLIAL